MLDNMRRLHPRGAASRGISADADGAMLGPDCILVSRTRHGYRGMAKDKAEVLQTAFLDDDREPDWLFHQCRRIADALNKDQIALAQIYGLRIPLGDLDRHQLKRLATGSIFAKTGFNPDEPRRPKGDPHGGEWTTGEDATDGGGGGDSSTAGGSDAAAADQLDAVRTADNGDPGSLPTSDAGNNTASPDPAAGGDLQPSVPSPIFSERPAIEYQIVPAGTVAADTAVGSFLGPLNPQVLEGLAQLLPRMPGPTLFFGVLFIPANSNLVVEGAVVNAPDLSYRYDRDTGRIQIWQDGGAGGRTLLDAGQIGLDGLFRDENGSAIGRALPNGAIIDPDTLPGYRAQASTGANANARAQALADTAQPKLCPDPTPENIAGRSDRTIAYQSQITGLPPGLEIVFNGERYDGCDLQTGNLIEAKGEGYANKMSGPDNWLRWFTGIDDLEAQMDSHSKNARGRIVEYHFAEKQVADWAREYAAGRYQNIIVFHTPRLTR
jgi:hypothetical protein